MEKEVTFKAVATEGADYIEIDSSCRIYYSVRSYDDVNIKKVGFDFKALSCIGYPCDKKNEYEFSPESVVEILVSGTAYFDGVRHLYFGSDKTDNFGYHYYPSLPRLIKVLKELRKLEEKCCSEFEINM